MRRKVMLFWIGVLAIRVVAGWAASVPVVRWDMSDVTWWSQTGLWNQVTEAQLANGPTGLLPFPSPNKAMYFGIADPGTRTGSYDTGAPVSGDLQSPTVLAPDVAPGDYIRVKFSYWRTVESHDGDYDMTIAYVVFQNGFGQFWNPLAAQWQVGFAGCKVFYKDSSDACTAAWIQFTSDVLRVPTGTTGTSVLFRFDTVDGVDNDHLGWLVDDVEIWKVPAPLAIVTTGLPGAAWDVWYTYTLQGTGGTPPYTWSVRSGKLPRGVNLDRMTGVISGKPLEAGLFTVTFVLTDDQGDIATKTLTLLVRGAAGAGALFQVDLTLGIPADWTINAAGGAGAQWHDSGAGAYYAIPGSFPSTYNTGARTWGHLTTPQVDVSGSQGKRVRIEFQYMREVEYATGSFDRTQVQVRFDSGSWTTLWTRDSRDPSSWGIIEIGILLVTVPGTARNLQMRFVFDSVDGVENAFPGWLITSLSVEEVSDKLAITTDTLPLAEVGVSYSGTLKATGGTPPYRWELHEGSLPDGLGLGRDTGQILGVPLPSAGGKTYSFKVAVSDATGARAVSGDLRIEVRAVPETLFFEDFEDFAAGGRWQLPLAGLWNAPVGNVQFAGANIAQAKGQVAYYGQDPIGAPNYDTGDTTKGALTSKPFPLAGAAHVRISFDYWRQVESYDGAYDRTYVEVRFGGGAWQRIWSKDSRDASEKAWTSVTLGGFTVPTGATTMQIRFVFDSVDRFNNNYVGWLVDNVRVAKATTGTPIPTWAEPSAAEREARISVFNYPNPVRDVHTTTFAVRGVEAEAIRVEVYDLTGRLVYKAEAAGNEIVWHTDDLRGRYLANGVYLYRVYVKVDGTWIASEVQKVVILR